MKQGLNMKKFLVAMAAVGLMAGCVQVPEAAKDPQDPFQGFNRAMHEFNMDIVDPYFLKPVTKAYVTVTPSPVRYGIRNFSSNLQEPSTTINALLQGKLRDAGSSTGRFVLNSTFGLLGIFDVASELGLKRRKEDFGQTLGVWGLGDGPYLVLPFMGPISTRSLTGDVVEGVFLNDLVIDSTPLTIATMTFGVLEMRASLMESEHLLEQSSDPYSFIKSAYFQSQLYDLYDGSPPQDDALIEEDDFLEEL